MNYIEKKILKNMSKKEWNKVIDSQYLKNKDKYDFLELFVPLFDNLTYISIIDKQTLEEVLSYYCNNQEYKSLFEKIVIMDGESNRVDLGDSIISTNNSFLTQVSRGGRCYIFLNNRVKAANFLTTVDSEKYALMSKLIMELYPRYVREVEYPRFEVTEETRKYILSHSSTHLECPYKVFKGKFYTDKEFEERSKSLLSKELPGEDKPRVRKGRK